MASLEERRKALEQKEKAFETKKKEAFDTIKYNLEQMTNYITKMQHNPFTLDTRNRRNQFYKNDITGELEHHLNKLKETFSETADEESSLNMEREDIEDEEDEATTGNKNLRQLRKRAEKIAADIMKEIGQISSDSGLCWIGDPAYVMHKKELPKNLGKDWQGFVDKLGPTVSNFAFDNEKKGLGITVTTGGDGSFPVYAKTDDGKVKSIVIIFDNEIPK